MKCNPVIKVNYTMWNCVAYNISFLMKAMMRSRYMYCNSSFSDEIRNCDTSYKLIWTTTTNDINWFNISFVNSFFKVSISYFIWILISNAVIQVRWNLSSHVLLAIAAFWMIFVQLVFPRNWQKLNANSLSYQIFSPRTRVKMADNF